MLSYWVVTYVAYADEILLRIGDSGQRPAGGEDRRLRLLQGFADLETPPRNRPLLLLVCHGRAAAAAKPEDRQRSATCSLPWAHSGSYVRRTDKSTTDIRTDLSFPTTATARRSVPRRT